jgi:hypothetical protein
LALVLLFSDGDCERFGIPHRLKNRSLYKVSPKVPDTIGCFDFAVAFAVGVQSQARRNDLGTDRPTIPIHPPLGFGSSTLTSLVTERHLRRGGPAVVVLVALLHDFRVISAGQEEVGPRQGGGRDDNDHCPGRGFPRRQPRHPPASHLDGYLSI